MRFSPAAQHATPNERLLNCKVENPAPSKVKSVLKSAIVLMATQGTPVAIVFLRSSVVSNIN
jgi:hypothetical protein